MKRTKNRSRPIRSLALTGIVLVVLGVVATRASAGHLDNMFPNSNVSNTCADGVSAQCKADNSTHTVATIFLGAQMKNQTEDTLDDRFGPLTNLTIVYKAYSEISWTGSAETDVIYWESSGSIVNGVAGLVACDDAVTNTKCDQFYVYYNSSQVASHATHYSYLEKLACHETGHTVGLLHGDQADPPVSNTHTNLRCMKKGHTHSDKVPGGHNIAEINSTSY